MPELKRSLSLSLVTFYGLGTILGAGIYVLLGSVSARAGYFLPLSFLVAALIAGFTAFSYAELVARMPRSGGEAVYVDAAFGLRWLTLIIGYGAVTVGIISAATIASGFAGYLQFFFILDEHLAIAMVVLCLGTVAAVGMRVSAWAATLMTLIEIGGLVLVIVVAGKSLVVAEVFNYDQLIPRESGDWRGIGAGAFLAFYAFLGFEDMVNVAEEVRDPTRNLPRAIIIALVVSTLLYLLVGIAAVSFVSVETLSASAAPMVTIAKAHDLSIHVMAAIALVAITNGALIRIIKSSRILYGMAGLGDAPSAFGRVSARTNTPLLATVVVCGLTLFLAISLATIELASLTSLVTLGIFVVVNASLWKLKRIEREPSNIVSYPITIPIVGLVLCMMLIAAHLI